MKKLDVPYFRQQQKADCLTACLKMILDYYNYTENYEDILKDFSFYDVGLYLPQIGSYLLNKGLKVSITGLNPYLFNTKDIGKPQNEIYDKIKNISLENKDFEIVRKYFLEYMDKGGSVDPAILKNQDITEQIDIGNPVLIILCSRVMHGHLEGFNFHSNIITGYDDDNFIVHDSEQIIRSGGTHSINKNLVLNSIHMDAYADLDNAFILKMSK